jgi:hypothetical protein
MIAFNKQQTRSLSRLLKKIDLDVIAFGSDDEGNVIVKATDQAGWTVTITIGENGLALSVLKEEDATDLRNAGIIS